MEQSTLTLLKELRDLGHECTVISLNELGPGAVRYSDAGFPVEGMAYRGPGGVGSFRALRRRLRGHVADGLILVGHNVMASQAIGNLCQGHRLLALHFHHRDTMPRWKWKLIYRQACRRFDALSFAAEFMLDEARQIYPPLHGKECFVSFPIPIVDEDTMRCRDSRRMFRERANLPEDALVIGNAGWLIARKRWDVFLDCLAELRRTGVHVYAAIAGDGPLREQLQKRAHDLGLQGVVRWLGWQNDMEPFYAGIDALLFNSDADAVGLTPAEAMMRGVPVVASVVYGGLSTLAGDCRGALVLPDHDTSAIVRRLAELLSDRELRLQVGKEARQRMIEVGDPRLHAERVVKALRLGS